MTKTDQKQIRISREGNWGSKLPFRLAAGAMALALTLPALAGQREQAKRMHDRLTGVPPTAAVLDRMEAEITAGKPTAAAMIAMDGPNNPNSKYFYNVTLKNFATPWTNEAQSVFEPLNDYSATIIGMVREGTGFDQLFSLDYVYAGVGTLPGVSASPSPISNAHYEQLEVAGIDLSDDTKFDQVSQVTAVGLPDASAAAGVFTTRAAARAFFIDGTNRAMFRFTMLNHLCKDMEQVKDTTRAADRIRQDVSRSPGGDSRIYMNACIGCHTGMDPMAQAFAYYHFDYPPDAPDAGRLVYTPGQVQPKYLINADNFKFGYITPDDRWDNYWREGPNAVLGWGGGDGFGNGARTMGEELAGSAAFGRCQAIKVFRAVCLRDPTDAEINDPTTGLFATYTANNSIMKPVFAKAATQCMGP